MESLFWLYLLIVLSGDSEINQGPESVQTQFGRQPFLYMW